MFVEVVVLELAGTGALLSYEALYLQTPKEWNGANVCPVPRLTSDAVLLTCDNMTDKIQTRQSIPSETNH